MTTKICVAVDAAGGFAKDGIIPWNIPEDFKHFMKTTKDTSCIVGRKSYDEMVKIKQDRLGEKYKPDTPILSNRDTYVLSNTLTDIQDATVITDLTPNIHELVKKDKDLFLLGGSKIFSEGIVWVDEIIMTIIPEYYNCDMIFPIKYVQKFFKITDGWKLDTKDHGELMVVKYSRVLRG